MVRITSSVPGHLSCTDMNSANSAHGSLCPQRDMAMSSEDDIHRAPAPGDPSLILVTFIPKYGIISSVTANGSFSELLLTNSRLAYGNETDI